MVTRFFTIGSCVDTNYLSIILDSRSSYFKHRKYGSVAVVLLEGITWYRGTILD